MRNSYFNSFQEEKLGNISDVRNFKNISDSIAHNFLEKAKKHDMIIKNKETSETSKIEKLKQLTNKAENTKEILEKTYNIINKHIWDLKTRLETEISKSWKEIKNLNNKIKKSSLEKQEIGQMINEININIEIIKNDENIINNLDELQRMEEERENFINIAESYLPYERKGNKE